MGRASEVELAVPPSERWRLSARDVQRMAEDGYFRDEDRVELIDGELLTVVPQGPEHRSIKNETRARLVEAYRDRDVHVLDQDPIVAGEHGLPEPDLAVIRGSARDYRHRDPSGHEAILVVEIAQTSQARDRSKAVDYARGRVPVYWLVDLPARRLDVYSRPDPDDERYELAESLSADAEVTPPELDLTWRVDSLLP